MFPHNSISCQLLQYSLFVSRTRTLSPKKALVGHARLPVEEEATADPNRVDTRVAQTSAHLRIVTQGSLSRLLSTEDRPKNLSSTSIFSKYFIKVVAHAEFPGSYVINKMKTTAK